MHRSAYNKFCAHDLGKYTDDYNGAEQFATPAINHYVN